MSTFYTTIPFYSIHITPKSVKRALSDESFIDNAAGIFQTGHGDPCNQGCDFLHRVINSGIYIIIGCKTVG